jgi:putative membrane protein
MRLTTLLLLAAGLLLFITIVSHYGAGPLAEAVAMAGWGLLWVPAFRFVTLTTDAVGWRVLFRQPTRPALGPLVRLRWIGEAINSLLPVAQVGGDLVRARLAMRLGVSGSSAGATVLVDFTLGLFTQLLYTILGVALLVKVGAGETDGYGLVVALEWGLLVALLAIAAFYGTQRLAPFQKLARLVRLLVGKEVWNSLHEDASDLDREVAALYSRHRSVMAGAAWRLATWLLHTGETWLALYFLGTPVSLAKALVLESLGTAIRSAAFAVPGGLGVQEGGFLLLGSQLGLSAEISLALALVKRLRELLVGGPGLAAWAHVQGHSLARMLSRRP